MLHIYTREDILNMMEELEDKMNQLLSELSQEKDDDNYHPN